MPTLKMIHGRDSKESDGRPILPIIMLQIAGVNRFFVVDTGANYSMLCDSLCPVLSAAQTKGKQETFAVGFGGRDKIMFVPVRFNLLGIHVKCVEFSKSIQQLRNFGLNIDGIIGNDILRKFSSVVFDFKNEVIKFNV